MKKIAILKFKLVVIVFYVYSMIIPNLSICIIDNNVYILQIVFYQFVMV